MSKVDREGSTTMTVTAKADRAALEKVLGDVEDLAGDAAMLFDLHADRLGPRRLALLVADARAARKRLARLVEQLPADPAPVPAWKLRELDRRLGRQDAGDSPPGEGPGQDGEAALTAPADAR
jgi:hypothetical protein